MKKIIFILIVLLFTVDGYTQDQTINGNLQINSNSNGGIRLGTIGNPYNQNVPVGSISAQFNIDFSGYRDVSRDQIGARIAAIRYNKYAENKAYIQNTALVFFTNFTGANTGATDLLERMRIAPNGNIGIGTTNPVSKLDVNGTIRAKEVKIEATGWADYVFEEDYKLPALSEVEQHIKEHKHLPDIPSKKQVIEEGVNVVEMQAKLLQKIEELTLYVIDLKKDNEQQQDKISSLEDELINLKNK